MIVTVNVASGCRYDRVHYMGRTVVRQASPGLQASAVDDRRSRVGDEYMGRVSFPTMGGMWGGINVGSFS